MCGGFRLTKMNGISVKWWTDAQTWLGDIVWVKISETLNLNARWMLL